MCRKPERGGQVEQLQGGGGRRWGSSEKESRGDGLHIQSMKRRWAKREGGGDWAGRGGSRKFNA